MISKPVPFKGFNTGIPIIIPMKGRGFISQGSTLGGLYRKMGAIRGGARQGGGGTDIRIRNTTVLVRV